MIDYGKSASLIFYLSYQPQHLLTLYPFNLVPIYNHIKKLDPAFGSSFYYSEICHYLSQAH